MSANTDQDAPTLYVVMSANTDQDAPTLVLYVVMSANTDQLSVPTSFSM